MSALDLPQRILRRGAYHLSRGGLRYAITQTARDSQQHIFAAVAVRRFQQLQKLRAKRFGADLSRLHTPHESGLVSIVLPVYNGGELLNEALDSILAQDYAQFELIAINDGSRDDTPRVLDAYAQRDARLRVVHQENRKIPRTLSRGFRMARGEFLTWTSADNRLRPQLLRRLVDCLRRNSGWDMIYANEELIGDDGAPLVGSDYFVAHQHPPGSAQIHFPENPARLNVVPENFIGAAFLYRDRVAQLLGDYSRFRFTVEDYDYFMQVNALCNLHHADFFEPLYEYRFHGNSLTARIENEKRQPSQRELDGQAQLEKLMRFDAVRRDLFIQPIAWRIEDRSGATAVAAAIAQQVRAAELPLLQGNRSAADSPIVYARIENPAHIDRPPPDELPVRTILKALILPHGALPSCEAALHQGWDLCITLGAEIPPASPLPRLSADDYRGLFFAEDARTLVHAIDVRSRAAYARSVEAQLEKARQVE